MRQGKKGAGDEMERILPFFIFNGIKYRQVNESIILLDRNIIV